MSPFIRQSGLFYTASQIGTKVPFHLPNWRLLHGPLTWVKMCDAPLMRLKYFRYLKVEEKLKSLHLSIFLYSQEQKTFKDNFLLKSLRKNRTHPAVVSDYERFQEVSCLDLLPRPGPEAHSSGSRQQARPCCPHWCVEAVNGDVLHRLGAQKMDEVHLDSAHTHLQLWSRVKGWILDWFTQLSTFQKAFLKHKMAFYGALCSEAAHW